MKTKILQFLCNKEIPFELGQVKGGYEVIKIPYKQRAEFIEYLQKNIVKMKGIDFSDDRTTVTIIFEKESKI